MRKNNLSWPREPTLNLEFQDQVEVLAELHYANMPMQFTAMFHGCKNGNFQATKCYIFLIFAQNIDCGYTLEPPQ